MNIGIAEIMRIAIYNVRGSCSKERELEKELIDMKIDVVIIPEIKKRLKGTQEIIEYLIICSGVTHENVLHQA